MARTHGTGPVRRTAFQEGMRHAVGLSVLTLLAHLVWETVQCPLLSVHLSYDSTWLGMVRASLGDVFLTWTIYAAVALVSMRWRWPGRPWRTRHFLTLAATAIGLAVAIELRGLSTGRWRYLEDATVLPGVGVAVAPILQLLLLTPILLLAAERLTLHARRAPAPPAPPSPPAPPAKP